MIKPTATPCIGICSASLGDDVCRGCSRFAHEVAAWNTYSDVQKVLVIKRLDALLIQIIESKFDIFDLARLESTLLAQGIAFRAESKPPCWVYTLLKATRGREMDTEAWGFRPLAQFASHALPQLYADIEEEFYLLSAAHYQRYVAPGIASQQKI